MNVYIEKYVDITLQRKIGKFLKYCESYFNIKGDLGLYFVNTATLSKHTYPLLKFRDCRKYSIGGFFTTHGSAYNKQHKICIVVAARDNIPYVLHTITHELIHWKQHRNYEKYTEEGVDKMAYKIVSKYLYNQNTFESDWYLMWYGGYYQSFSNVKIEEETIK